MCYSAMVDQRLKALGLRFKARVDYSLFKELYRRRKDGSDLSIPKGLDANFYHPSSPNEAHIKDLIDRYVIDQSLKLEQQLFQQRARLAEAERKLAVKFTKTAQKEKDVSERQADRFMTRLDRLKAKVPSPNDARIFPFQYAPVILEEKGERIIRPMRYHCRIDGKPDWTDQKFDGLYNARKDNLGDYWKPLFGKNHALLVVDSFFENVKRHDFERRELVAGEKEENIVLHFRARGFDQMLVPCIWDHWTHEGKKASSAGDDFYSFALITDDPPPEVAVTGHNRCPIFLKEGNVARWLSPDKLPHEELLEILNDRERPYYEHELAA